MRAGALSLAIDSAEKLAGSPDVDFVMASSMLDLPCWQGLISRRLPKLAMVPTAIYFHENQWMYPRSAGQREDHHYGYTNLLSAISADRCLFNSEFHRDGFIRASEAFVQRMPDSQGSHDFAMLRKKSMVIPPGFEPSTAPRPPRPSHAPLRIGWVARWEHDKRPDRFVELLDELRKRRIQFKLILLGERDHPVPAALDEIRSRFGANILLDGYAESNSDYWNWLGKIDVVVSTADHEFFGIAVCESIWAGAAAVLPYRLSYPELIGNDHLYTSNHDAADMIATLVDEEARLTRVAAQRSSIERFRAESCISQLDDALLQLAAQSGTGTR